MIINFAPETIQEEVDQNIRCILETVMRTVPLARSIGLDSTGIDLPIMFYESQMTNKIITAIQEFEPRAVVSAVTYATGNDGMLKPDITYQLRVGGEA